MIACGIRYDVTYKTTTCECSEGYGTETFGGIHDVIVSDCIVRDCKPWVDRLQA